MVKLGDTFHYPFIKDQRAHLHVVITVPDNDNEFIAVSITSLPNVAFPDLTVILDENDDHFIEHKSIASYVHTKYGLLTNYKKLSPLV